MKPDCESLDLKHARIVVTGGAGFLGRAVMAELATRGATDIMIPRRRDFDFTREADVARLYAQVKPDVVLHLAAEVGGIGANPTLALITGPNSRVMESTTTFATAPSALKRAKPV